MAVGTMDLPVEMDHNNVSAERKAPAGLYACTDRLSTPGTALGLIIRAQPRDSTLSPMALVFMKSMY